MYDQAIRAAKLYAKKSKPGLGAEVYDDLAQATALDLLRKPPGSIKTATGLAISIIDKKLAKHFERKRRDEELQRGVATEVTFTAETDSDRIDARRLRGGFRSLDEQRAAVMNHCKAEFHRTIGRAWGGVGEAAWFRGDTAAADRAEDREAQKLIQALRDAVGDVVGHAKQRRRGYQSRQLQHFAQLLRALIDDAQWKIWQPRIDLPFVDNLRSLLIADHDHEDFFGLKRRATPRELAVISILCGSYPGGVKKSHGIEQVIAAEMRAIARAQARYGGLRDLRPRERRSVRGRKPKG